jgi:hypothetical protein
MKRLLAYEIKNQQHVSLMGEKGLVSIFKASKGVGCIGWAYVAA